MNREERFCDEVETGIAAFKRQVGRTLQDSKENTEDAEGILSDLESQIRSELAAVSGRNANISDLNATLLRMDPPESYGNSAAHFAINATPGYLRSPLKYAVILLVLIVGGLAAYYMVMDARLCSQENNSLEKKVTSDRRAIVDKVEPVVAPSIEQIAKAEQNASSVDIEACPTSLVSVAIARFSTSGNIQDSEAVEITISDGLINALAFSQGIRVVEREKLYEGLDELRMSAEGMLDSTTAFKLGKIVGAQIIITGNIVKIDNKLIITARLINSETSELSAVRVTGGRVDLLTLTEELAQDIVKRVQKDEKGTFVRRTGDAEFNDMRAKSRGVKEAIAGKTLPRVLIMIPETHLNDIVRDPAAETELVLWFTDCGFLVASPEYEGVQAPRTANETTSDTDITFHRNRGWRNEAGNVSVSSRVLNRHVTSGLGADRSELDKIADVIILGEGISEKATEREGLISCKARVELKVIDVRTGQVLMAKSAYGAGVDVAERIAGKRALQAAGRDMAVSIIPELVDKWTLLQKQ